MTQHALPQGYGHPLYLDSLSEFGQPVWMPRADGGVLVRPIGDSGHRDGIGAYPLFACRDWLELRPDLDGLAKDLISVTVVADPFGAYTYDLLVETFDQVRAFKKRFVVDLSVPRTERISSHHRRMVRKSMKALDVEVVANPEGFIDEWLQLYDETIQRHSLSGIKAFSRRSFETQLRVPGMIMVRAVAGERTVGLNLWYESGECAYGHLAGISPEGYAASASYAMYEAAFEWFSGRVAWLDLGGAAGASAAPADSGLDYFKSGWATGTRSTYICLRILDSAAYGELTSKAGAGGSDYFPAYRKGEFG